MSSCVVAAVDVEAVVEIVVGLIGLHVVALAVVVLGLFPDLLVGQFVNAMKIAGL